MFYCLDLFVSSISVEIDTCTIHCLPDMFRIAHPLVCVSHWSNIHYMFEWLVWYLFILDQFNCSEMYTPWQCHDERFLIYVHHFHFECHISMTFKHVFKLVFCDGNNMFQFISCSFALLGCNVCSKVVVCIQYVHFGDRAIGDQVILYVFSVLLCTWHTYNILDSMYIHSIRVLFNGVFKFNFT